MEVKTYLIILALLISKPFTEPTDIILAIHPPGDEFSKTITSLETNLDEAIQVKRYATKKNSTWSSIRSEINLKPIKAFFLLDNSSLTIYKDYLGSLSESDTPIPAIATMAIQLKTVSSGLPILGINYEIPAVTSVVNLRVVSKKTINKVGVLFRGDMNDFIEKNKEYCQIENIELIPIELTKEKKGRLIREIKKGLRHLIKKEKVDAIWVLNDNIILNEKTLQKGWVSILKKSKIPVIVGLESLINTKLNFGNFAVTPDNISLGSQISDMVFELQDNNWVLSQKRIDEPLSVLKFINTTLANKKRFLLKSGLSTIDKEIK
jgi:hypothetical protein